LKCYRLFVVFWEEKTIRFWKIQLFKTEGTFVGKRIQNAWKMMCRGDLWRFEVKSAKMWEPGFKGLNITYLLNIDFFMIKISNFKTFCMLQNCYFLEFCTYNMSTFQFKNPYNINT
jgi:hypothetical protein